MFIQALGFPVQVLRGFFVVWGAVAIWGYPQELICAEIGHDFRKIRAKYAVRSVVILVSVLCLGLALTSYLEQSAYHDLLNESTSNVNALANHLQDQLDEKTNRICLKQKRHLF